MRISAFSEFLISAVLFTWSVTAFSCGATAGRLRDETQFVTASRACGCAEGEAVRGFTAGDPEEVVVTLEGWSSAAPADWDLSLLFWECISLPSGDATSEPELNSSPPCVVPVKAKGPKK